MTPVKLEGRVVGVVQVMSDTPGAYGEEHLAALEGIVAQVAVAMQNARLYDRAQREVEERRRLEEALRDFTAHLERRVEVRTAALEKARERAEVLAALSDALQGARTVEEVAHAALARLGPAVAADYLFLSPVHGERVGIATSWGPVPPDVLAFMTRPDLTLAQTPRIARAARTGEAVYVDRYRDERDAVALETPLEAVGYEPVRGGSGPTAAVLVACRGGRGPWLSDERGLLARAAAAVGLALERAEAAARLEAQRAELEARNAEQETFAYTVSHDLRAPLLSLQGMAALLEEAVKAGDADEAAFAAGRITRNVEKMGALLNDLLTLARVGRADEAAEALDLGPAVAAVLSELEPRLRARRVRVEVPDAWPAVRYPPLELYQVLANLTGNAAKWAGGAGEGLRVALSWTTQDGLVTLRVSDNGPGVPPSFRERVFDLFKKIDPKAEGTGVGLAIVKRIAERHGGKVWVEDSPIGGATFAVTLPVA